MARIGVIACEMIRRELELVLPKFPEITEVVWLQSSLHVDPRELKEKALDQINEMKDRVDVIFLGYAYCQSLKGIEAEVDIPVILPPYEDCLAMLLTPERYAEEKQKEIGTFFMTPGLAEGGTEMVIRDLHLDRARKHGKDPMDLARMLFTNYRRGLYIDTGVGQNEYFREKAADFCRDFNLVLDETTADTRVVEKELIKCRRINAAEQPLDTSNDLS